QPGYIFNSESDEITLKVEEFDEIVLKEVEKEAKSALINIEGGKNFYLVEKPSLLPRGFSQRLLDEEEAAEINSSLINKKKQAKIIQKILKKDKEFAEKKHDFGCDTLGSLQKPNNAIQGTLNEWTFRNLNINSFDSYIKSARTELEFKQPHGKRTKAAKKLQGEVRNLFKEGNDDIRKKAYELVNYCDNLADNCLDEEKIELVLAKAIGGRFNDLLIPQFYLSGEKLKNAQANAKHGQHGSVRVRVKKRLLEPQGNQLFVK
ncbi:350_t:CDS:2, partial [Entrophospora sp. SA101]